jgi:hypothetical protein
LSGYWVVDAPPDPVPARLPAQAVLGALSKREATPMADDADSDWQAAITRPVRVLFCLFVGGVAGVIGCAAAFVLNLPITWTVVTVAALTTFGAVCEWEYTATLGVGRAKPRRVDSLVQNALVETDTL